MNLVILDGSDSEAPVSRRLLDACERRNAAVRHFALSDLRLAPCLGDFACWTKTPGLCHTRDVGQDIAQAMHQADLVIFLSPITFGGYSSNLKKAVDRLIGLVQPFFHDRDGLTRHTPRYERYAPILFVGITKGGDREAVDTFHELALSNATNLIAPYFYTHIVSLRNPRWAYELEAVIEAMEEPISNNEVSVATPFCLEQTCAGEPINSPTSSAAILVGSARPKGTSTSESLARELLANMHADVRTTVIYASQFIKFGPKFDEGLDAILSADLLVVAAPIYVDGLPYLVTSALEQLSVRMKRQSTPLRRIAGLLNCGYPEAVHNHIAMRLLRNFARQNGLSWAGGLALGAGEVIHGRPIRSLRFLLPAPVRALRLAALELSSGRSIPSEAIQLMAKPLVPPRLFRWLAKVRWMLQARKHKLGIGRLKERPWEQIASQG